MKIIILFTSLIFCFSSVASDPDHCIKNFGYWFYCDESENVNKDKEQAKNKDYNAQMSSLREKVDYKKNKAILNPTENNVKEYIELQNALLEKSQNFTEIYQKVLWDNPELSNKKDNPTNHLARYTAMEIKKKNIKKSISQIGKRYGLFFIYRSTCPFCHTYSPIINKFGEKYNINIVGMTIDNKPLEGWEQNTVKDIKKIKKLNIEIKQVPATILYDSKSKKSIPIGFEVLSHSELEKRIYFLIKDNEKKEK